MFTRADEQKFHKHDVKQTSLPRIQEQKKFLNTSLDNLVEASHSLDQLSLSSISYKKVSYDISKMTKNIPDVPKTCLKNKKILEQSSKVLSLDWASDSHSLLTSLKSGELCIWDTYLKINTFKIDTHCTWLFTASFSPSQTLIAAGGLDSKCNVYKLPRGKSSITEVQHVAQHQSYVLSCSFTTSDHQILTASSDATCALWDVELGTMIKDFKGHTSDVASLDYYSNGYCFVTGSADTNVGLWDMRTGSCVRSYNTHSDEVNQVRFFPNGEGVASASDDLTCRFFDFRMDAELAVFFRKSILFPACSLDFSLSGRLLFVGYGDHSIHIWDTLKNKHCGSFNAHGNKVNALRLSPDGTTIATGSWDQTVYLWSL
ncbi:guanine nucleotide-binding protein subunit beta-5 isoform X1 [Hydra vulgaris]|uniref:guanine nucleotide-binding protein subunit beta-5 isoform X1 n=1 Tax=Hydra vulgaris TaxID=6087 RepID=UPI00019269E5|nr:guanine nucleotide-binding protein subunit beta-5 [Hydra vulgaris]